MKTGAAILVVLLMRIAGHAQHDRLHDPNFINWVQSVNTISLNKTWSIHTEYQWRRTNGLRNSQQNLLRLGINYRLHDNLAAHLGYGWIDTAPYGDFPLAANGNFPEHRIYEQLSIRQPLGKWSFTHRFRVEQRWLGKRLPGAERIIDGWTFLNRFRYQFRTQYAAWSVNQKQLYVAAADEIFIGAGKNLGTNIFDQNRIFLLAGYSFNDHFSIEGGFLNQTLQQGKKVNDRTIIQQNNGWILSSIIKL